MALVICQVDRLGLSLPCDLQQRLDVFVLELTLQIDRLLHPHAEALADQFFSSHCWSKLASSLAIVADLVEAALDAVRRHSCSNQRIYAGDLISDLWFL